MSGLRNTLLRCIPFAFLLLAGCATTVDTGRHRADIALPDAYTNAQAEDASHGDITGGTEADEPSNPDGDAAEPRRQSSRMIEWRDWFSDSALTSLIDSALRYNTEVRIAEEYVNMARADVLAAGGSLLPTIDAALSAGQSLLSENSSDWAGSQGVTYPTGEEMTRTNREFSLGIEAAWEIDIWGKLRDHRQSASARYLASIEERNRVVTDIVAEIASTYYELISIDVKLRSIEETTSLREQALAMIRMKKEVGAVNDLAVKQFEAQLLSSRTMELELLLKRERTESAIHSMLNSFPVQIPRMQDFPDEPSLFQRSPASPTELLDSRADLRAAEFELAAAELELAAAEKALYPSLRLFGDVRMNAFSTAWLLAWPQSLAYSVFGSLTAPLFNRTALKADIIRAQSARQAALLRYRKAVVDAYLEVNTEIAAQASFARMLELRRQRAAILSDAVTSSLELFRSGRATYLEVLLAEEEALEARLDVVDLRLKQHQTLISMYRALGGGWVGSATN